MINRIFISLLLLILILVGAGWLFIEMGAGVHGGVATNQKTVTKRYRVDLTFQVAGEVVSGSGVFVGDFTAQTDPTKGIRYAFFGRYVAAEAIPIQLPSGAVLVATILTANSGRALNSLFLASCGIPLSFDDGHGDKWLAEVESWSGNCNIDREYLPQMVLFDDKLIARGTVVDPLFDDGIHFVEGSVSTTDEPIVRRIKGIFPWATSQTVDVLIEYSSKYDTMHRRPRPTIIEILGK
jgi:hypothetical protein